MKAGVVSIALIFTWLITPDSLNLSSRAAGEAGDSVMIVVSAVCGILLVISAMLHNSRLPERGYVNGFEVLRAQLGNSFASVVLLGGRIPLLLFASTGMLASAGFAFNEIFVYWFPNFLFASAVLWGIVILHLCGDRAVMIGQIVFVVTSLAVILVVLTLAAAGDAPPAAVAISGAEAHWISGASVFLLCFVGIDFYVSQGDNRLYYAALAAGFALLAMWALMSRIYLGDSISENSMISHMRLAREAAGESGRHIMGIAVISGVAAGVNGLMVAAKRAVNHLADGGGGWKRGTWVEVIVYGAVIEIMMLTGVAGDEVLETQLRGALLLWLLHLGMRVMAAGKILGEEKKVYRAGGYGTAAAVFVITAYLLVSSGMALYLLLFMGMSIAVVWFVVIVFGRLMKYRHAG